MLVLLFRFFGANKICNFDDRITFRRTDKIPYGTYAAFNSLNHIFPKATISTEAKKPGWEHDYLGTDQAVFVVSPSFNAGESEVKDLINFVKRGNDVFISTMKVSFYTEKLTKCNVYFPSQNGLLAAGSEMDSLSLTNAASPQLKYDFPGQKGNFWFYGLDSSTSTILGTVGKTKANFIHLKTGKGNLYLHLTPMAFTNYFLLYKNNISYYEQVFSMLNPNATRVVWDEYFLKKRTENPNAKKNWFSVFMSFRSLRAALITAMIALLVFVLFEMRRKQRMIPLVSKLKNDSLDFVKTIGRLYHDRGDHHNLAKKMSAYFLEHIRGRYKLKTGTLDSDFVRDLHFKTGVAEQTILEIVSFINNLEQTDKLNADQLAYFYKQLESFYKTA